MIKFGHKKNKFQVERVQSINQLVYLDCSMTTEGPKNLVAFLAYCLNRFFS
jgi:hypothetical protein